MISAEDEERARLDACQQSIRENLQAVGSRLNAYAREIQETKDHMWEARRDMDHIDKVALRQSIEQKMRSAEVLREQRQKLLKLRKSPYFGRFDFARGRDGNANPKPIYVGVHDFRDEETGRTLVHDWRAPVTRRPTKTITTRNKPATFLTRLRTPRWGSGGSGRNASAASPRGQEAGGERRQGGP